MFVAGVSLYIISRERLADGGQGQQACRQDTLDHTWYIFIPFIHRHYFCY